MVEDISAVNFSFPLEMASLQQLIILLAARKYFGNELENGVVRMENRSMIAKM